MIEENRGSSIIPYSKSLDGVRGLAVLAVLVEHVYQDFHWEKLLTPGYFGVRLFFVISGYLITAILLKGRVESDGVQRTGFLKAFYVRRTLRIFPIYYLALVAMAMASIFVNGLKGYYWWRFAYLTNFHMAIHNTQDVYYGHLWTLAVEEQFYLVWPALILFAPRRILGPTILGLILSAPILRSLIAVSDLNDLWIRKPTWACFDSLGMGALIAFYRSPLAVGGLKAALGAFLDRAVYVGLPLTLAGILARNAYGERAVAATTLMGLGEGILFAGIVYACTSKSQSRWKSFLCQQQLTDLGKISYGLYLYHAFLMPFVWAVFTKAGLHIQGSAVVTSLYFVALLLVSIAVAGLSWHFIEKPLNRYKRHFGYREAASHTGGAGKPLLASP